MSTDRELLELAAPLAGRSHFFGRDWHDLDTIYVDGRPWNPLTNDGDALRLAVKLNLRIDVVFDDFMHDREFAEVRWDTAAGNEYQLRESGIDPFATTRRAIVRAAAEIGKNIQ